MRLPREVYMIKHNITNRVYIGSSCCVKERVANHLSRLQTHTHYNEDMQADFDKYGENYTIEVLDEILCWDEREKEYQWMKKLKSNVRGVGYNYLDKVLKPTSKHFFDFNGERLSISGWAKKVNLPYGELYRRLMVEKWGVERALTEPRKYLSISKQRRTK